MWTRNRKLLFSSSSNSAYHHIVEEEKTEWEGELEGEPKFEIEISKKQHQW